MAIYHGLKLEDLPAGEGREFVAVLVPEELGDALRRLDGDELERVEGWLRADLDLGRDLLRSRKRAAA